MILVDTSAWIAFQHDTESAASQAVRAAIDAEQIATTDLVVAEFLAGVGMGRLEDWSGMFALTSYLPQQPWSDALAAGAIYRACRRQGQTPRSIVDCMIAAVALRNDVAVLHADRDYDAIARCTDLEVVTP
jgi:predicted nucleic acid-binding protein